MVFPMDQLAALRSFIRIVETRSFTKAAAHLGVPRSTISKQLQDLERHVQAKLIQRTTRAVTLTPEGAAYYQQITPLIARLEQADAGIQESSSGLSGRLRVDVHSSMANFMLIPALADFRERYPGIHLALGINDRPVSIIEEGVDCVVRAGLLPDTSLVARTVLRDSLITCASPDYIARRGEPLSPDDLDANHEIVGYFSALNGDVWPMKFKAQGKEVQIFRSDVSANESTGYINMVASGLGIGQTFRSAVRMQIDSGSLIPVLENWTQQTMPISVVYPPTREPNARLRAFIDWLTEHLSGRHD